VSITPEQRAEWRRDAYAGAGGYPNEAAGIDARRILALLDALEASECGATTTILGALHVCTRPRNHASHQDGTASWSGDDRPPVPLDEVLDRLNATCVTPPSAPEAERGES